jgi:hypothetical protein
MAYAEVTNPGLDLAAYWAGLSGLSWRGTDLSLKPGSIPRVTLRKFRWQIARGGACARSRSRRSSSMRADGTEIQLSIQQLRCTRR